MTLSADFNRLSNYKLSTPFVWPGQESVDGYSPYFSKNHQRCSIVTDMAVALVTSLAQKGWDVPGIKVKFEGYQWGDGPNASSVVKIAAIAGGEAGERWQIEFGCKAFGSRYMNITSAISRVNTQKQELQIYSDHSPLVATLYAGDDWLQAEHNFIHGSKAYLGTNRDAKDYLQYQGDNGKILHYRQGVREPDSTRGEQTSITVDDVLVKAVIGLAKPLEYLLSLPDSHQDPAELLQQEFQRSGVTAKILPMPTPRVSNAFLLQAAASYARDGDSAQALKTASRSSHSVGARLKF
ncbi:MAG: hypothetical protein ACOYK8_01495 [Alphaproteobacteria bacterium]